MCRSGGGKSTRKAHHHNLLSTDDLFERHLLWWKALVQSHVLRKGGAFGDGPVAHGCEDTKAPSRCAKDLWATEPQSLLVPCPNTATPTHESILLGATLCHGQNGDPAWF